MLFAIVIFDCFDLFPRFDTTGIDNDELGDDDDDEDETAVTEVVEEEDIDGIVARKIAAKSWWVGVLFNCFCCCFDV